MTKYLLTLLLQSLLFIQVSFSQSNVIIPKDFKDTEKVFGKAFFSKYYQDSEVMFGVMPYNKPILCFWDASNGELINKIKLEKQWSFRKKNFQVSTKRKYFAMTEVLTNRVVVRTLKENKNILTIDPKFFSFGTMAFSDNEQYIAVTGSKGYELPKKGFVGVWNVKTGKKVFSLQPSTKQVTALAFSHDSKRLAVLSESKTIKIFDVSNGKLVLSFEVKNFTSGEKVAFTKDDQYLVVKKSYENISVINLQTKQITKIRNSTLSNDFAIAGDSQKLAFYTKGSRKKIEVVSLKTGKVLKTLKIPSDTYPKTDYYNLRFAQLMFIDNSQVLVIFKVIANVQVIVWDLKQNKVTELIKY